MASDPTQMYNSVYENSSTWTRGIPPPEQGPPSGASYSRTMNPVSRLPPSGPEFQYNFAQPGSQFRVFSNSQASTSHVNTFQHQMTVPLLPGNSSQVYGAAPPFENTLNTTASPGASSSYVGGQPPSLSQQADAHSAGTTRVLEASARFNSHQQTEVAPSFPPPPPDPYTTPNPQGAYNYLWQLSHIWIEHLGSDDLRLVIQLKKVRSG